MDAAVRFPTTPQAVRARALTLSRRMSVEQAWQEIMRNCLDQIEANEHGVIHYHDVESLHQMRVGLRRLRSALGMFDEVVQLPVALQVELDWLVAQLGPARDWDVLVGSTLPRIAAMVDKAGGCAPLEQVRQAAVGRAGELHALAGAALASERYQDLIGALERWFDGCGWRVMQLPADKMRLKMRIGDFAGAILAKDQQRLLKRGRKLKGADPEARHRLRIAAKKTRYAAEFFASLYPRKTVRPYVKALSRLQDELGCLNDANVADRLLRQLGEGDDSLKEGTGFARGYLASCSRHPGGRLCKLWKRFVPLPPPG